MVLKHSKQRDSIYEFLQTRKDHPTADVVYMNVRQSFPNISLGTVYRNLTLLADLGQIARINVGDGVDHFDACTAPHYHFICKDCGAVIDLEMPYQDSLNIPSPTGFHGTIEGYSIYYYGICENCLSKANN